MSSHRLLILGAVLTFLLLADLHSAQANPGFARRFGFSCVMCHSAFPKLNSFGEAFGRNGYQLPGQDVRNITEGFGDPKLYLEKNVSLGFRVDSALRYTNDTDVHTDFQAPLLAKIFASGYLQKDITFYFYFLFEEGGEVTGIEDAFFYFNNMIGNQDLDLMLGQFQVVDVVYPREQRLTYQDIVAYDTEIGKSEFSLTYQRGAQLTYGKGPFDLAAGIVNGNGLAQSNAQDNFDNNSFKDPFGRIGLEIINGITTGWYGFYGMDRELNAKIDNRFYREGPDLRIQVIPKIDIRSQWLFGRDDNPDFTTPGKRVTINSGFAEVTYLYSQDWVGVLLYNWYDARG
ncbi:MAG: hypothetical protein HY203_10590, partial [Nitrospirae bacterium]|nr:hypothetical protein [Nitrospirota bacterium]